MEECRPLACSQGHVQLLSLHSPCPAPLSRPGTVHRGSSPSESISNRENALQICVQGNRLETVPQLRIRLPRCVKLTRLDIVKGFLILVWKDIHSGHGKAARLTDAKGRFRLLCLGSSGSSPGAILTHKMSQESSWCSGHLMADDLREAQKVRCCCLSLLSNLALNQSCFSGDLKTCSRRF